MLLAAALCGAGAAHAEEVRIYRSTTPSEPLPIYSDRPLNRTSRVVALLDGRVLDYRARRPVSSASPLARRRAALAPLVQDAAHKHRVPVALLTALIEVESGFNAGARSPKGALGLMQVMPATAARYGRFDLYSPKQNLDAGTRYLRYLLDLFGGNLQLAVAAYNAGEYAVIRNGRKVPPYKETQKYVPRVIERYLHYLGQGAL